MSLTVLQIIPSLGPGGAEQACVDVALGLKERGDRALVVSAGGRRVTGMVDQGVRHFLAPVNSKNPLTIIKNALWLSKIIRDFRVDVVHARSRAPAWSAWIACRKTSCQFVTTFHAAYKFNNVVKKTYNSVMAKADRMIAISNFVAAYIDRSYRPDPKKIRIIYRGVDLTKFAADKVTEDQRTNLRQVWDVPEGKRIILLPSRLSPIKGQRLMIKAMALMPPDMQDTVGVILGNDQGRAHYRQELEGLIEAEGLDARVRLVPDCSNMPAAYSLANLVVMPSSVPEGFGRVPVEAMAMGVPVIASGLGATPETIIEGETGWLLSPADAQVWADAMTVALRMSAEARRDMAEAGMRRVRENFNERKMVADTLLVYDELVRDKR